MTSGIIFSEITSQPDHTHVGAWRDDDGRITVAYLGIFHKRSTMLGVEVGGAHQTPETMAFALLADLVRQAEAH